MPTNPFDVESYREMNPEINFITDKPKSNPGSTPIRWGIPSIETTLFEILHELKRINQRLDTQDLEKLKEEFRRQCDISRED